MNNYDKRKKHYKDRLPKDEHDFIIIVDGDFKDFDDKDYLYCEREFIKITNEMCLELSYFVLTDSANLSVSLSDKIYSSNYQLYFLNFLISENPKLKKYINNILMSDYRLKLQKVNYLKLYDMIIDKEILEITKKMFPNLERIAFINCDIEKSCYFNNLNCEIIFDNCKIDSISSFNYYTKTLDFHNCKINDINHSIINSKKFTITNTNDEMLEKLFVLCHFSELQKLTIGSFFGLGVDDVSYKKALLFLSKACPRLLKLQISGKVYSFDFLSNFNKLSSCEITSNEDKVYVYETYNPYVENEKERNFIISHSKIKIDGEMSEHFAMLQKLDEIVRTLNKLGMSEEEKNLYLNKKMSKILLDPINDINLKNTENYYLYDSRNDDLILTSSDIDNDENNCYEYTYKIFNGILYRTRDKKVVGYLKHQKELILQNSLCIIQ